MEIFRPRPFLIFQLIFLIEYFIFETEGLALQNQRRREVMMDRKTIPEILFEEFREGEVYSRQGHSIFYQWARFRDTDDIILVLKKYSDGSTYLDLQVAWLEEDGKYDDYSTYKFATIDESWRKVGEWVYGMGERLRKAVTYTIENYYGLEITSKISNVALAVVNRARELTREYVPEEKWSATNLERPENW